MNKYTLTNGLKIEKLKKCKGTGKAIDFGCSNYSEIFKYGLCKKCFIEWLYNTDIGKEVLNKSILISRNKIVKEVKKQSIKNKIENKTIALLINEAKAPFQKLIRIRDHRQLCICCDKLLPFNIGEYDAGHYFKAELYTGLIFHPHNVHGQRVYCNQHLHGNESGYTNGIIRRIGWSNYQHLNFIKDKLKSYKWDRQSLIEMKKYYQNELKLVEKGKMIKDVDLSIGIVDIPFC